MTAFFVPSTPPHTRKRDPKWIACDSCSCMFGPEHYTAQDPVASGKLYGIEVLGRFLDTFRCVQGICRSVQTSDQNYAARKLLEAVSLGDSASCRSSMRSSLRRSSSSIAAVLATKSCVAAHRAWKSGAVWSRITRRVRRVRSSRISPGDCPTPSMGEAIHQEIVPHRSELARHAAFQNHFGPSQRDANPPLLTTSKAQNPGGATQRCTELRASCVPRGAQENHKDILSRTIGSPTAMLSVAVVRR